MQIRCLKVFCDVVDQRSFSQAARDNHLSQSSASQMVHQLEQRLEVQLIDRSQRPLLVTPEGELFYEGCRKLLRRYFELEKQVRQYRVAAEGQISIAAIYSVGLSHLNDCVKEFLTRHPESKVRVEYQRPDRVYGLVEERLADLGLVSYPRSSRRIRAIAWRDEPMALVCAPGHALADRASVNWQDLHGLPMVSFSDDLRIRREIDRALSRHGVAPRVVMEFDNIETIKRALEIDAGVSLLPHPTVQREIRTDSLVARRFADDSLVRPLGIIHRRDCELSNTARGIIDLLQFRDSGTQHPDEWASTLDRVST